MNPTADLKTTSRPQSPKPNRTPAFSATIVPESKFTQILKAANDQQRPEGIVSATEVLTKSDDLSTSKKDPTARKVSRALSESNNERMTY